MSSATPRRAAISGTSSVTAEIVVEKALWVPTKGYLQAVRRVEAAVSAGLVDEVFISVTEALQWLTNIAERRAEIKSDQDVQALIYARERAHHQSASIIYAVGEDRPWFWRPAVQLPLPDVERHRGEKHREIYVRRIEGKPLLEPLLRVARLFADR